MAKIFYTEGTGAQQALNESDNNKLKVFDTYEDIDTTDLVDGEIISTKDVSLDGSNVYDYIDEMIDKVSMPVGALAAFPLGTTHHGWLACDGRDTTGTEEELATHYPALYTYLGDTNVLPEKYETSKDTRVFMTVNDPQASLSGNIQIENASHVTSIEVAGATRANQHNLARLAVDLTTATSLLFGFGGSDYTITINGTYNSTNDTWNIANIPSNVRGLFINYDELGATETRRPLYIKATSAGIEVDKDLYATKGYVDNSVSYSTTETLTGGKWIDGKPIYRVVLYKDVVNLNSSFLFTTTIANVDKVLDMRLCLKSSNNVTQYAGETHYYTPYAGVDEDGTATIQATRQQAATLNGRQYCIVEYTKI